MWRHFMCSRVFIFFLDSLKPTANIDDIIRWDGKLKSTELCDIFISIHFNLSIIEILSNVMTVLMWRH